MGNMGETVVGIGTRKGLWLARSEDRQTWRVEGPHFLMSEVLSVLFDTRTDPTRLLVGFRSSHWGPSLQHSDDLGATWVEHPEGSIRFPEDTDTALKATWQLVADPHDPAVVWAGTEPQGLWRSADRGETFELNRGLWEHPHRPEWGEGFGGGAIHTVLPNPADADHMLVAMSTGGVYNTRDGGASWTPGNTGIHAYFQPHDEWPEFGQCVHKVAHPSQGDTMWLVPIASDGERIPPAAELQVQRTDDAGATWRTQHQGLPSPSYTNVLRDAACLDTDLDEPGLYLGTRNGEVYASVDGGDSFARIAEQLPDVLCVRAVTLS
jgi:photosystem II stability/assembly factor-like uncharacterized protein